MPGDRQVTAREELARKIAELERGGAGGAPPRSARVRESGHAAETAGAGHVPATAEVASEEPAEAPLPTRDVEDDRGPSLTLDGGQIAHDEALGVGAFAPKADRKPRKKKPKPAALAFSDAPPHQQAIDLAYKLVAQRERTAKQIRDKLTAKECAPEAIDAALAELQRHGFQDDRRYARLYAEDKRRLQAWGDRRIRMELTRAGISRELLDAVLHGDEPLDAPTEMEAALELLSRKRPDLSDPKVKQRMAGMLARRGIASSTVFAALREHAKHGDE